jgi:N-methylhydantoinase B
MKADPILLELLDNALASITDEMGITIYRTAHSGIVKDILDFSVAVCDREGRMVGQGATLALHLGSVPAAMEALPMAGEPRPGDVFILNDPYNGGVHLPDVYIIVPVFRDKALAGYTLAVAHQSDMGGRVAGSNATDSREIFEEGLRIPPMKLYDAGKLNEPLMRIIETNVRLPRLVAGDLRAQMAACEVGAAALLAVFDRCAAHDVHALFGELLDHAERLARAEIAAWPDGEYVFTDYMDSDGAGAGPVKMQVKLTVKGDALFADFAGTDAQVAAAINCPLQVTKSTVYAVARCAMKGPIPSNAGLFRAIHVSAPEGSVVNMRFPAACAARGATAYRVTDTVLGAMAQIVPQRIPAACEGGVHLLTIGGFVGPQAFVVNDIVCGTGGGRPDSDGIDGIANPVVNLANTSIEVEEIDSPVRVEEYGYVPDSGGPGEFRGGLAIARAVRFLGKEGHCLVRGDRREHPPWGLDGGLPGAPSTNELAHGEGTPEMLDTMQSLRVAHGDVVRLATAGGGGHGDPLRRDPDAVLRDVREGKVTPAAAYRQYGVVIASLEGGPGVDDKATQVQRERMRAARASGANLSRIAG